MDQFQRSRSTDHEFIQLLHELGKLGAFLRRDFLVAWSYRHAFALDLFGLLGQVAIFYFMSLMIDASRIPTFGQTRPSYLAFVAVGITIGTFLHMGMGRMISAMRQEQLVGTLEPLLMTPTSGAILQLGLLVYDLVQVPIQMGLFLLVVAWLFGVEFQMSGIGPAIVTVLIFIPFVWGLAAASAASVLVFRQATSIVGLVGFALAIGSGAYFPIELLPDWIEVAAKTNPVALTLGIVRAALLGGLGWRALAPQMVLLIPMAVASLIAGTVAFRLALQYERRAGTLGLY